MNDARTTGYVFKGWGRTLMLISHHEQPEMYHKPKFKKCDYRTPGGKKLRKCLWSSGRQRVLSRTQKPQGIKEKNY